MNTRWAGALTRRLWRGTAQPLPLRPLGPDDMQKAFAAILPEHAFDAGQAELSQGSVGRAAELVRAEGSELYAGLVALMGEAPNLDRQKMLGLAERHAGRGKADASGFL